MPTTRHGLRWLLTATLAVLLLAPLPSRAQDKVYWAERASSKKIKRNLDGTNVETLITGLSDGRDVMLRLDYFLPVELVSFEALADGSDALLTWRTASETNNAGFEVQRMARGQWEVEGFVDGHGTSEQAHTYSYRVANLAPGRCTFRLKQIDYDGTFDHSPELEVAVGLPAAFLLSPAYPNPSTRRPNSR